MFKIIKSKIKINTIIMILGIVEIIEGFIRILTFGFINPILTFHVEGWYLDIVEKELDKIKNGK